MTVSYLNWCGWHHDILINLDRDTQLHYQYEQLGRERADEFTWDRCVDRLVDVFHQYS